MSDLVIYSSPRACSSACHIALEESGLDYDFRIVRIRAGETRHPGYLEINPAGKVPALAVGRDVLTETPAILDYVAERAAPAVRLLPEGDFARSRALEWMSFLVSTVHLAFRPLFKPQQFVDDETLFADVRRRGAAHLRETLAQVERRLPADGWALGERYSVVDPYLLVFHIWARRDDIRVHVDEMPRWMAHRRRIEARPATRTVFAREGITAGNVTDP